MDKQTFLRSWTRLLSARLLTAALLIASIVSGCTEDPAAPSFFGGFTPDIFEVKSTPLDVGGGGETTVKEVTTPDTFFEPTDGGPGWPCDVNSDCNSDWCIPTSSGKQCSELCVENCSDPTWGCKEVQTLGDPAQICVPLFDNLCNPCDKNEDCSGFGNTGAVCLKSDDGSGSFCGGDCSTIVGCPTGYTCEEFELTGIGTVKQCVPDDEICTCSPAAISQELSTQCTVINEVGTCTGSRTCAPDGLTNCSAPTPTDETCDGKDNDCDGLTDEEDAAGCELYYKDLDEDNYGTDDPPRCLCAPDGSYSAVQSGDCDDKADGVNPGELELCDEKDNDCDAETDEADALGCKDYFADIDEDTWGDPNNVKCLCSPDDTWNSQKSGDCDDQKDDVFPGAPETCSGYDQNCDQQVGPENTPGCTNYYLDTDLDQYGVSGDFRCLCAPDAPYTATEPGDCDDGVFAIKPGADETCDGKDNDCDGTTDPTDSTGCTEWLKDGDKDNYGGDADALCLCAAEPPYDTTVGGDCNDTTNAVSPDAQEKCNGIDDDCDSATDEEGAGGCKTYYRDEDNDGYGVANDSKCLCVPADPYDVQEIGDCDDILDTIGPGNLEQCGNNIDDDCDNATDEEGAVGCTDYWLDVDDDGFGVDGQVKCLCGPTGDFTALKGGDCLDSVFEVNPEGTEVCGDGVDNDCKGGTDEENAVGCENYYFDGDKDQAGVDGTERCLCAAIPAEFYTALLAGDCKDTNDKIYPGQTEVCNQEDDDCNDIVDDEGAVGCSVFYFDSDDDDFGVPGSGKCLCGAQGDTTAVKAGDCNDNDLLVYPAQPCNEPSCSGHIVTNALICSGEGVCDQGGGSAPCPGGYVCENASVCKTACTGDGDCITGNFCVAGVCTGKKLDGSQCSDDTQCQSGHCQNNFCCASGDCCGGANSQCNDQNVCTDDVCTGSFQCSSVPNAVQCEAAFCDGEVYTAAKTCNGGSCTDGGAATTCTSTDPCLTASCTLGGCTLKNTAPGVSCTQPSCTDGLITAAKLCDGAGGCSVGGSTTPCPGGYACESANACGIDCQDGTDCRDGFYCTDGLCLPEKTSGSGCSDDSECATGYCEGGFCCEGGECCSKSADCNDGNVCTTDTCLPSFQCAHPANSVQCLAGSCDADVYSEPMFCDGGECTVGGAEVQCDTGNPCLFDTCGQGGCGTSPVPIGTICEQPVCGGFTITNQKTCDGVGGCELGGTTKACAGGYSCAPEGDSCRTTCESNAHCQPGLYCQAGACLAKKTDGGPCQDDTQCVSGYCNNGFCCTSGVCCGTGTDCDDDNVCTTDSCSSQKKCVYTFNTLQCEGGSCNGSEYTAPKTCLAGECTQGGATQQCDLGNPCRNYGCSESGCTQTLALNGTVCAEASCSGSNFTPAHTCTNGTCINPGAAPCPSGTVCASGSSCATTCTDGDDCQSGWYCTVGGNCQPKRDNGDSCTNDTQCSSSHCNNGFCCNTGVCCSKTSDCDDDNVCTTEVCTGSFICSSSDNSLECEGGSCDGLTWTAPKSCNGGTCAVGGGTQDCSGTNPCKSYSCSPGGCEVENLPAGLQCAAPSCTQFILTAPTTCSTSGTCNQGGSSGACAGGYRCADSTTCRTSCSAASHCAPSFYCGAGVCQPKRVNGDACQGADQCASGYCANGYCCNGPTGDCCAEDFHCNDGNTCTTDQCGAQFGCTHTPNTAQCAGASCDGLVHTAETYCSGGDCNDGGTVTDCSGTNPCKVYACTASGCATSDVTSGIQCAPQSCSGFQLTQALTCNGNGSCSSGGTVAACAGGLTCLDATTCRSNCSQNSHCQDGFFCSGTLCQAQRDNGESCTTASQCASGYCANGFCCDDNGTGVACCGGSASQCDDGNICTDDSCGAGFQCVNADNTGKHCEPASCSVKMYTTARTCLNGTCSGGGFTSTCAADTACRKIPCVEPPQPGDPGGCIIVDEPVGTPCGSGTCSGHTLTASSACDGNGSCVSGGSSGPCPGGFICADASSCRTTCATNDDCQPGLICQDGVSCVSKKPNGQQCTQGSECLSNYCNSGFCCDSGVCCQVPSDCDDDEICTNDLCTDNQCSNPANTATCAGASCDGLLYTAAKVCSGGSCPLTADQNTCGGPNPCKVYGCTASLGCTSEDAAIGTQCQPASCTGSTLTQAATCNGAGSCQTPSNAPCPGNLRCASATACASTCSVDADCVGGYYCSGGSCLPKKTKGSSCSGSNQCLSDYCNGGYCCDSGQCCVSASDCDDGNSCTTNLCSNNQCTLQYDNNETCQAASCSSLTYTAKLTCQAGSCSQGGATTDCSGTNPCKVYGCSATGCTVIDASTGTTCAPGSCADGTLTEATTCNGSGSCSAGGSTAPCAGGLECLNGTTCRTSCTNDSHCRDDYYCQAGSCLEKKTNGSACAAGDECQSEYCSNGYCCASGVCCASAGNCDDANLCTTDLCTNNQCTTTFNSNTCGSGQCSGLIHTSANTCELGSCSGGGASQDCSGTDPCKTYGCQASGCIVGNQPGGTQCQPASCTGSTLTTAQQCNGSGLCSQGGVTGPCPGNFTCKNSTQCNNTCSSDSDCVTGAYCDGGACLTKRADGQSCTTASQCQSDYCNGGFCCAGGDCCTSSAHCGDGNVCTTDSCVGNMCSWTNNTQQCAASSCSGLIWTAAKFCSGGSCTGGGATTDCSGSNECLSYTCGNLAGCSNAPKDSGTVCADATCDGTEFTPASVCNGNGSCIDSAPQECDDGDICTGSETCSPTLGCVDGNPNLVWVCGDGTCSAACEDASSCGGDCQCSPEYTLALGEVDSWASNGAGSTNRIDTYGCSASTYPGNEYTYEFVAPRSGNLEVRLVGADAQTDVLILSGGGGSCDPAACTAQIVGGGSQASFSTVAGATYFFVVDRRAAGAVSFEIATRYTDTCTDTFVEGWERTNFPRAWTSTDNWQQSQDTPFGQWHAKFTGSPTLTTFERALTSPAFNTATCASQVEVGFQWRFTEVTPATVSTAVDFVCEVSTNGGGSWTEIFGYNTIAGVSAATETEAITTAALAGSTNARIRFVVKGPTSSHINRFQLENITVTAP